VRTKGEGFQPSPTETLTPQRDRPLRPSDARRFARRSTRADDDRLRGSFAISITIIAVGVIGGAAAGTHMHLSRQDDGTVADCAPAVQLVPAPDEGSRSLIPASHGCFQERNHIL
jgi:hypothetical protein